MSGSLSVSVLNSGYKPIPGGAGWDPTKQPTRPDRTATLIAGDRDAILSPEVEGHVVLLSAAGQGDGALAAIVHVPDIATVPGTPAC